MIYKIIFLKLNFYNICSVLFLFSDFKWEDVNSANELDLKIYKKEIKYNKYNSSIVINEL